MCNILETKRLILRKLTPADKTALRRVLQDKDAMYAYEHAFCDEEVQKWRQNQLRRYREDGFGLWGAALKGKLSLAVADIQNGERVIDVALKYGYSSPTAFSRAFQGLHGITPSEARKKGTLLKTYPPISFKLTIITVLQYASWVL